MPRNARSPNTNKGRGERGPQKPHSPGGAFSPASHQSAHSQSPEDSVTTEAILAKLTKAKQIEASIEAAEAERKAHPKRKPSPTSDGKSQALRLELCSLLSDVILLDCTIADSSDAIGRLWKICFYGRINDIRNRIVREKSRAKKRAASGVAEEAEAAKKAVENLEKQLKKFLTEAQQLYKYLIERYVKELMPLSQTQGSQGSDVSQEEERSLIVVSSLYRMHIHLGDLYRYAATQNKQAEECYLASARLAPGTGNPFNQLAVVAQQSQDNMTAAALYYYARSLMASRAPFETSRSNLVRLFEGNRRWLEEHARDDSAHSRGIVDIMGNNTTQKGKGGKDNNKKGQKEWMQKERAALNRKALARFVDLQWAFFRGVSLGVGEADDDKIDLDGLVKKMGKSMETFGELIGHASFGEGLLCKLVSVLAFSTLGASNSGRLMNATEGFDARRAKDPGWNEGIVMTNQALAFGYFLRFCAILARDVDAVIAKREESAGRSSNSIKLGAIRSFSPMLLGFRFATSLYEGSQWFHGLPFFPTEDVTGMESSTVHKFCKESHNQFWKSIATLANRLEALPKEKKHNGAQHMYDLTDVKDFDEYHGYVPFASFMDKSGDEVVTSEKYKKTKYASADEAISALAETKSSGGKGGGEAETRLKIDLFLSIADGKTRSTSNTNGDDQCFLEKDPETNKRDIIMSNAKEEEEVSEQKDAVSPISSPHKATAMEADDIPAGIEEVHVLIQSGENVPQNDAAPFLLTPSALLAGASSEANKQPSKSLPLAPVNSILAQSISNTEPPSNLNTATTKPVDSILNSTIQAKQPEPAPKAGLLPPPGFSMQPPQPSLASQLPHAAPQLASSTMAGISLADFTTTTTAAAPSALSNVTAFGSNQATMMPQAGPGYSAAASSTLFETLNPFAQQQAHLQPPSINNIFLASSTSVPNLNQQLPGLLNIPAQGSSGNLQQPQVPSNNMGLDPTLDFLLSNNRIQTATPVDQLATSSNAFNLLVPSSTTEPMDNDPSESIMNFLFDSNHGDSSRNRGHTPLYAAGQHGHQVQAAGMPHTKNPFAT